MKHAISLKALALLMVAHVCLAQDFIEISGTVLDAKTKEPLPYSNIFLTQSPLGTIANESGEFVFHLAASSDSDTLKISFIGYKTFVEKVSVLRQHPIQSFLLVQDPVVLQDVEITSDGAKKMVVDAVQAIQSVYPVKPYLQEGFHRSWEKIDFTDSISYPGTLIEAAVTIYDPGYGSGPAKKRKEEIFLNEIRRSAMMEGWNYGHGNFVRDLLDKNLVKYNTNRIYNFIPLESFLEFPNGMTYEWDGVTKIDGDELSIVNIKVPNAQHLTATYKVYISDADHAILRFEFYGDKSEIEFTKGAWHIDSFHALYTFKRFDQKTYLSYARIEYVIKNLDVIKRRVLRTEEYFREIMFTNIITKDVEPRRKSLSGQKAREVSLAIQSKEYNDDFWKHYNVIKENPLDKEIVRFFDQKDGKGKAAKKKK